MSLQNDNVMIQAEGLTKKFGDLTAVKDVTFRCKRGEIVGFLGPNGAGKTTTMRMLTGFMPPTDGAAYIAGHNTLTESIEARQKLGYLPETVPLYQEMSVENYLAYVGRLRRVDNLWERVDDVLESVDLLDRAETHISRLSKGMRQRVGLAQALIHDPDVLILDEPTIGLDPAQILEVRELVGELGKKHTILLSTHILPEVEQICNRVIMIFNGRIWADMQLEDIMTSDEAALLNIRIAESPEGVEQTLLKIPGVTDINQSRLNEFTIINDGRDATRMLIAETVVNNGWGLLSMAGARMNLETVFLNKMREADFAVQAMAGKTLEEEESAEMDEKESLSVVLDEAAFEEEE
ncbi:MAG: ATP-binding cassette domain-containing protein [Candidatus Promineifilaceae bacterium]